MSNFNRSSRSRSRSRSPLSRPDSPDSPDEDSSSSPPRPERRSRPPSLQSPVTLNPPRDPRRVPVRDIISWRRFPQLRARASVPVRRLVPIRYATTPPSRSGPERTLVRPAPLPAHVHDQIRLESPTFYPIIYEDFEDLLPSPPQPENLASGTLTQSHLASPRGTVVTLRLSPRGSPHQLSSPSNSTLPTSSTPGTQTAFAASTSSTSGTQSASAINNQPHTAQTAREFIVAESNQLLQFSEAIKDELDYLGADLARLRYLHDLMLGGLRQ